MPTSIQALVDDYYAKGLKLWNNRARLNEIIGDIDNGIEPDLDAGWESVD